jgi:hypothetical protein
MASCSILWQIVSKGMVFRKASHAKNLKIEFIYTTKQTSILLLRCRSQIRYTLISVMTRRRAGPVTNRGSVIGRAERLLDSAKRPTDLGVQPVCCLIGTGWLFPRLWGDRTVTNKWFISRTKAKNEWCYVSITPSDFITQTGSLVLVLCHAWLLRIIKVSLWPGSWRLYVIMGMVPWRCYMAGCRLQASYPSHISHHSR